MDDWSASSLVGIAWQQSTHQPSRQPSIRSGGNAVSFGT